MNDYQPTPGFVDLHGPFLPEWRVTLYGYEVPNLKVQELSDGRVDLSIDGRFMMPAPVSREEFDRWLPILANAMAVSAGYSCHGENSVWRPNPYKRGLIGLASLPADPPPALSVITGGRDDER